MPFMLYEYTYISSYQPRFHIVQGSKDHDQVYWSYIFGNFTSSLALELFYKLIDSSDLLPSDFLHFDRWLPAHSDPNPIQNIKTSI